MTGRYRIEVRDESCFLSMRETWNSLAARSTADPLFGSWDWLATWWRYHSSDLGLSPILLLAYDGEVLVGIAPCYEHAVVARVGWRSKRVELMGNLWRTSSSVMSERTGFIVDREHPGAYVALAAGLLKLEGWGDFVLSHSAVDGPTFTTLRALAERAGCFVRVEDAMPAYQVDVAGGFDAVLSRISSGTRRQLFNKRGRLESLGGATWEAATADDASAFYADLDRMYEARWGRKASDGRRGQMYREFGESLQPPDEYLLRRLRVGGRTIAAARAFRCGDRIYDIQSAMDPGYSQAISPGYLQAGFLLEEACRKDLRAVDFLGGPGRAMDYKARLGGQRTLLACLQIVRSPVLKGLHRLHALGQKLFTKAGQG